MGKWITKWVVGIIYKILGTLFKSTQNVNQILNFEYNSINVIILELSK